MAVLLVEAVLGNVQQEAEFARLRAEAEAGERLERIRLNTWEAQKSRLRAQTDRGTPVAISLQRGEMLRHGDLLAWDRETGRMIIVELEERQVLVVRIQPVEDPVAMAGVAVKLGHILGNQHWPVKLEGLTAYVPVVIDQKVMETVLRTHGLRGIEWEFQQADPAMELPLICPSLEEHVHAYAHQHGIPHSHEA